VFVARATDKVGGKSAIYTFTGVVNVPPVIDSVTTSGPVVRGQKITLTAVNAHDTGAGNKVTGVQFYLDVDKDGKIDKGDRLLGSAALVSGTTNYVLTVATTGWAAGDNKVIARATDNNGGWGTTTGTASVTNIAPTVTGLTVNTNPLSMPGGTLKLTATAKDPDGKIAKVAFYYDTDGSGDLNTGDVKIGEVTGPYGWALTTTNTGAFATGAARYFAVATDNDGGTSNAKSATGTVNVPPTVGSMTVTGGVLTRADKITMTAVNVADTPPGKIAKVDFFRDLDRDGIVDPTDKLLGTVYPNPAGAWSLTVSAAGFAGGENRLIARATDNNGGTGTATASVTIYNHSPQIASLSVSPTTVARGAKMTLTANGAKDADGTIFKVEFFVDVSPGDPFDPAVDLKIGEDANPVGGFSLPTTVPTNRVLGTTIFFARAFDNDGTVSNVVTTSVTVVNVNPTIGGLTVAPATVTQPANITLTATGVADPDSVGVIQAVRFYEDVNKNGAVDAADQLLGQGVKSGAAYSLTVPSSAVRFAGLVRFLAVAEDNDGGTSKPASAYGTVRPAAGIDLIAMGLTYSPKAFDLTQPNQTITVSGTIRNSGAAASAASRAEAVLVNQDTLVEYSLGTLDVAALASLAQAPVSITAVLNNLPSPPPAGSYSVILRADTSNQVAESNELNNDLSSALADVIIAA
jgi:hypothetical protein